MPYTAYIEEAGDEGLGKALTVIRCIEYFCDKKIVKR
jgi:hypothetical protein